MLNRKQDNLKILFKTDVNHKIGMGHLSRCRSLIYTFLSIGRHDLYLCTKNLHIAKKFIINSSITFLEENFGDLFVNYHVFNITIVDEPTIFLSYQKKLRKISNLLICIDDEADGIFGMDILIRPNLLNMPCPINFLENNYWTGREYIILNPNFLEFENLTKSLKDVHQIIVCFGGSDPGKITMRIVPILKKITLTTVMKLIVGEAFKDIEKLRAQIHSDSRFVLNVNQRDMATVLFESDIAIISGGTLMYEACSLGIPSIVICQNEAQNNEGEILKKKGAILSLGIYDSVSDETILANIQKLILNENMRHSLNHSAKKVISASGSRNLATKILNYYEMNREKWTK